jgi:hypothetical protein
MLKKSIPGLFQLAASRSKLLGSSLSLAPVGARLWQSKFAAGEFVASCSENQTLACLIFDAALSSLRFLLRSKAWARHPASPVRRCAPDPCGA